MSIIKRIIAFFFPKKRSNIHEFSRSLKRECGNSHHFDVVDLGGKGNK